MSKVILLWFIQVRSDNMEEWQEVFVGQIPQGNYQTQVINGEEKGLILDLKNEDHHIVLDFGFVRAIRMLDEGIV